MIILDEQLLQKGLESQIAKWYHGSVKSIVDLRPNSIIKDDNIARLLRQQNAPSFVTINEKDFWQVVPADKRFCLICFRVDTSQIPEISLALREIFQHSLFDTKIKRMGKVIRVVTQEISFYSVETKVVQKVVRIIREEQETYEVRLNLVGA